MFGSKQRGLIRIVQDQSAAVEARVDAAGRLSAYSGFETFGVLSLLLRTTGRVPWILWTSVGHSLATLGWRPQLVADQALLAISVGKWEEVLALGPSSTQMLTRVLSDFAEDNQWPVESLMNVLAQKHDIGTAHLLVDLCYSQNKRVSALAKASLINCDTDILVSLVEHYSSQRRSGGMALAVGALGSRKDPRALDTLVRIVEGNWAGELTDAAGESIVAIGDEAAISPFLNRLPSRVVKKLGPWALSGLVAIAMQTKSYSERRNLINRLQGMQWSPVTIDECVLSRMNVEISTTWDDLAASAVGPLLHLFEIGDDLTRKYALRGLVRVGAEGVLSTALDALSSDTSVAVRSEAADSLVNLMSPGVNIALIKALSDNEDTVVHAAVDVLGTRRVSAAAQPMVSLLSKKGSYLCTAIIRALGRIGNPVAIPSLALIVNDHRAAHENRIAAAESLAALGSAEGIVTLLDYLVHNSYSSEVVLILGSVLNADRIQLSEEQLRRILTVSRVTYRTFHTHDDTGAQYSEEHEVEGFYQLRESVQRRLDGRNKHQTNK
jgi:HEAT repeat protein